MPVIVELWCICALLALAVRSHFPCRAMAVRMR